MASEGTEGTTPVALAAAAAAGVAVGGGTDLFDAGTVVLVNGEWKGYFLESDANGLSTVACIYGSKTETSIPADRLRVSGLFDGEGSRSGLIRGHSRPVLGGNGRGGGSSNRNGSGTGSSSRSRNSAAPRAGAAGGAAAASSRGALTTITPPRSSAGGSQYERFEAAIKATRSFVAGKENAVHPLATYFIKGSKRTKGWLREALPFKTANKQMGERERTAMILSYSLLAGVDGNNGAFKGVFASLANAWGVTDRLVRDSVNRLIECDFNIQRKERSDKGETVFTSESRRSQVFTAFREFCKDRRHGMRAELDPLSNAELKQEFAALSAQRRLAYRRIRSDLVRFITSSSR